MSENNLYHPSEKAKNISLINKKDFSEKYYNSIELNDEFWSEEGKKIEWIKPFSKVKDVSYDLKDLHIRWFYDGSLNVSSNCLDRHLEARGNQIAIIWEGDDPWFLSDLEPLNIVSGISSTETSAKKILSLFFVLRVSLGTSSMSKNDVSLSGFNISFKYFLSSFFANS